MGEHFIERCSCGIVLNQCRCPGPKTTRVSSKPCTHRPARAGLVKVEFLSIEGVLPPARCGVCGDPAPRLVSIYFPPGTLDTPNVPEVFENGGSCVIGACAEDHTAQEYVGAAVKRMNSSERAPLFG